MLYRKSFIIFIAVVCIGIDAHAQPQQNIYKEMELFGGINTTHYLGDVGGSSDDKIGLAAVFDNLGFDPLSSRLGLTFGSRYVFAKNMAVSAHLSPMFYYGSDENSSKERRAYYFNTFLFETSGRFEYYFANRITGFAPFGQLGLGGLLYWFNPRNAGADKTRTALDLIIGVGTRLPSMNKLTHSFEVSFHYYFTDLLDGFQGNRQLNDTGFTLHYYLNFEWVASFIYDHRGLIR